VVQKKTGCRGHEEGGTAQNNRSAGRDEGGKKKKGSEINPLNQISHETHSDCAAISEEHGSSTRRKSKGWKR